MLCGIDINMTGVNQLRKHQPFLSRLANTKHYSERKQLVKRAQADQLKCVAGVAYNTLKGKLPLSKAAKKHVLKNRLKLRRFVNSCCSPTLSGKNCAHVKPEGVKHIRQQLVQQRGGIFPLLIPLLALAGKAALAGVVSSGVGYGVKKLI